MAKRRRIELTPTPAVGIKDSEEDVLIAMECEANGVRLRIKVEYNFWVLRIDGNVKVVVSEFYKSFWKAWDVKVKDVAAFVSEQAAISYLTTAMCPPGHLFHSWHEVENIVAEKIPLDLSLRDFMNLVM